MTFKFAHIADCHLGAWRDPQLRALNIETFSRVIDQIILEKVDFVIIAGDLFNTAIPSIDVLKVATEKLKKLLDEGIRVYGIAGSHDYSAAGKSMLEVLEKAGVFTNVMRGKVIDEKLQLQFIEDQTGVKITGVLGKRGTLEKSLYESLDYESLEKEPGKKIFIFHSSITDITQIPGYPLNYLPKGFIYYAGGHVHIRAIKHYPNYSTIVYPGPVFPNSFSELEDLQNGSYCIVTESSVEPRKIPLKNITVIHHIAENISGDRLLQEIIEKSKTLNVTDAIVLIRIEGNVQDTIPSFQLLYEELYARGAYHILRNTVQLKNPIIEHTTDTYQDIQQIEKEIISEVAPQSFLKTRDGEDIQVEVQEKKIKQLMHILTTERKDGETIVDYEERIIKEFLHNE